MADRKGLSAWQWSCRGVSISISSYVFPANKMNTFTARVLVICPFSKFITIRQARKVNVCEHQFFFVFILSLCCIVLSKLSHLFSISVNIVSFLFSYCVYVASYFRNQIKFIPFIFKILMSVFVYVIYVFILLVIFSLFCLTPSVISCILLCCRFSSARFFFISFYFSFIIIF